MGKTLKINRHAFRKNARFCPISATRRANLKTKTSSSYCSVQLKQEIQKQEIQRLKQEQSIVDYKIEIYAQKMLELE